MKYLLLILAIFLAGCEDDKICWDEMPLMCHTQAEWDQISKDNLASIACFEKNIKRFKNNIEETNKFCGDTTLSTVEFAE